MLQQQYCTGCSSMTLLTFRTKPGLQLVDTMLILVDIVEQITRAFKTYLYTTYSKDNVKSVRNTLRLHCTNCMKCFALCLHDGAKIVELVENKIWQYVLLWCVYNGCFYYISCLRKHTIGLTDKDSQTNIKGFPVKEVIRGSLVSNRFHRGVLSLWHWRMCTFVSVRPTHTPNTVQFDRESQTLQSGETRQEGNETAISHWNKVSNWSTTAVWGSNQNIRRRI